MLTKLQKINNKQPVLKILHTFMPELLNSFLIPHLSLLLSTDGACDIPIFRDYKVACDIPNFRDYRLSLLASHFLFLIPSSTNYLQLSHSSPLIPHSSFLIPTYYQWSLRHPDFSGL